MKSNRIFIAGVALASALVPACALAAPPVPDVNVVNTPDVNVANTPDVRVINTLSVADFSGARFGPGLVQNVIVFFPGPVHLRAVSVSVAPEFSGDVCNVNVSANPPESSGAFTDLGLSAMSNGEAVTTSRNYEVPIEIQQIEFDVTEIGGNCWLSLSLVADPLDETSAAAESLQAAESGDQVRIEVVR